MRALAAVGVFIEGEQRQFGVTPVGYHLRSDTDPSLHAWTAFVGRPSQWKAWTRLGDSVRIGENAFRLAHDLVLGTTAPTTVATGSAIRLLEALPV